MSDALVQAAEDAPPTAAPIAPPPEERAWVSRWPPRRLALDLLMVLCLTLFAFYVREWRIGLPPNRYFDETYYVKSAYEYLDGKADSNTVHPPLGKLLIAAGIRTYQTAAPALARAHLVDTVTDGAGWRLACLVAGVLMVPLTYALGFRLFRSRFVAATAAWLVVIDPLHIAQSRIAMLDMMVAFFILLGAYGAWRFIEARRASVGWAVFTALVFGLGAAVKWNSLFAGFGACIAMLALKPYPYRGFRGWAVRLPLIFIVVVTLAYMSAFVPFFHQGHDWRQLYANHKQMVTFRYSKEFTHRYMSHFWDWPTIMRPVWYHYEEYTEPHGSAFPQRTDTFWTRLAWRGRDPNQYISGVVAIGSIFVWITFLIFFFLTLGQSFVMPAWMAVVSAWRRPTANPPAETPADQLPVAPQRIPLLESLRDWRLGPERPWIYLVLLYLPQVVLWSVNKGFLFYMLPCIPFMAILVAAVLNEWLDLSMGRTCVAVYLLVAALCALAYYPLLTAYPIPRPLYDLLIPTSKWV